ncbi:MAG: beta-glucosidase [Candidatus Saccharibacteria bacterium]|nr:beta-glucosidase [Candidatus Saccharibacteria bacterium]
MTDSPSPQTDKYPTDFLWGAATAAHQVEGHTDNQWTDWERQVAPRSAVNAERRIGTYRQWPAIKDQAVDPANYISGALGDHYHRYNEDFDFLESMNMNAYRFSLEWSRIEPEEGEWDDEAVKHYGAYIDELRTRNIEPVMTLLHFTLPKWFAAKGGFESSANIPYFTRFSEKIVKALGEKVRYIITINEPEVYAFESYALGNWPPGKRNYYQWFRVLNNQLKAHNDVADAIHGLNAGHQVSIAKNSNYFYQDDGSKLSQLGVKVMRYLQDDYVLRKVVNTSDYLGINFYQTQRMKGLMIANPGEKVSDVEWEMEPELIEQALVRLYGLYQKPILITENGLADGDDDERQWWIHETVTAMNRAIEKGVDLRGYLHWSLLDNFEWAYGKWPRFGLVSMDYETGDRQLRPSARWFGSVIRRARGLK